MKYCAGEDRRDCRKSLRRAAGYEQVLAGINNSFGNSSNLLRSFALSEHHLWKALPNTPVVVDPRKSEILEGSVAQKLKEPGLRSLRRYDAGLDRLEQRVEFGPVHRDKSLTGVDFGPSWTVKLPIVPCDGIIFL
jgi:hypothetical protein